MTVQRTTTSQNNDRSARSEGDLIGKRAPMDDQVDSKGDKASKKSKAQLVTAIFRNRLAANAAVDVLMGKGYTQKDISLLMTDSTRTKEFGLESGSKVGEGAGAGGVIGGAIGAAIAAIAAIGTSLVVPGLGLVVAGPIAAALAGAGAGGAAGTPVGALVGAGIPEHRAKVYEAGLREGGILLGVEVRSSEEASALEDLLEGRGGEQIKKE